MPDAESGDRPLGKSDDLKLFRRAPVLVGDEPAVLRHARGFRKKRRAVQLGFVAGVAAIAALSGLTASLSPFVGILDFAVLSSAFVILHLAVGKRVWMKPIEVYDEGIAGCEITILFCRRRFLAWKDVDAIEEVAGPSPAVHRVKFAGSRALESAPGEFDATALQKVLDLLKKGKEEAERARAIFESVGKEKPKDG